MSGKLRSRRYTPIVIFYFVIEYLHCNLFEEVSIGLNFDYTLLSCTLLSHIQGICVPATCRRLINEFDYVQG